MLISCISTISVNASDIIYPFGNTEEIYINSSFVDKNDIKNLYPVENLTALGILYSDGKNFNPQGSYTNAYALRTLYRSVNREEKCFELSSDETMRKEFGLGSYDDNAWADGFYMQAEFDGLIVRDEFINAYVNKADPLSKDNPATVDNIVRWLCILNKIPADATVFAGDANIPETMRGYVGGLYKNKIFSKADAIAFSAKKQLTKDDFAYILSCFEEYILKSYEMSSVSGTVAGITESYLHDRLKRIVSVTTENGNLLLITETPLSMPAFEAINGEIPVFGKGECDTTGCIRYNEKLKIYLKNGKALFLRVTTPQNSLEYISTPMAYRGKLYLYDYVTSTIILKNASNLNGKYAVLNSLSKFYLSDKVRVFYKNKEVDISRLNDDLCDMPCVIYITTEYTGGINKVYSIVID